MKILHLPTNTAGNAFGLAQGERMIGLDSKALSIGESIYHFPSDIIIPAQKTLFHQLYHRAKTFLKVRNHYDVYHFNFGSSLIHYLNLGINLWDLPFYNKNATKVVTYQGCDARQKYPTIHRINQSNTGAQAACFRRECYNGICNSGKRDTRRQEAIDKMMTYCHHAFALNPDLLYFLPKEKSSFLPYTVPHFDSISPKKNPFFEHDKIHIVHAPTQRVTKGSEYVIQAVQSLQDAYPNRIVFTLVENKSYEHALNIYRTADLVIDQLLIGWYGGLAVEVMKMGVPVAAYINEADLHFVPREFATELPIIKVNMNNLLENLTQIVKNREQLLDQGKKSLHFVNKWHHPREVAHSVKRIYQKIGTSLK